MKMAAKLPETSAQNGLYGVHKRLIQAPTEPLLCLVIVDSNQTLEDHDKHTKTATIRVRHIEPMCTGKDIYEAQQLLQRAYRDRTSEQLELDYEFEPTQSRMSTVPSGSVPFTDLEP